MRLGMGVAQITGAFAVLIDDAHRGLDHVLGHRRFAGAGSAPASTPVRGVARRTTPWRRPSRAGRWPATRAGFCRAKRPAKPDRATAAVLLKVHHGNCASSGPPRTFRYSSKRPALFGLQQAADHAVAALAGAEFVAAVVIAGDARVEHETIVKGFGAIAQVPRVVFEGAFIEGGGAFILR